VVKRVRVTNMDVDASITVLLMEVRERSELPDRVAQRHVLPPGQSSDLFIQRGWYLVVQDKK